MAGTAFFVVYLVVLPFAAGPLFRLAGNLLGMVISDGLQNVLTYYILFCSERHHFPRLSGPHLPAAGGELGHCLQGGGGGLVALYGLNELVYRLTNLLVGNRTNLNNTTVFAQIDAAPHVTILIVVFLAPLWRRCSSGDWCSGTCGPKSRLAAYAVSCLLFALLHVWQFAVVNQDITYFLLMIQYTGAGTGIGGGL